MINTRTQCTLNCSMCSRPVELTLESDVTVQDAREIARKLLVCAKCAPSRKVESPMTTEMPRTVRMPYRDD
jgi:hypothetical protein